MREGKNWKPRLVGGEAIVAKDANDNYVTLLKELEPVLTALRSKALKDAPPHQILKNYQDWVEEANSEVMRWDFSRIIKYLETDTIWFQNRTALTCAVLRRLDALLGDNYFAHYTNSLGNQQQGME